MAAEKRIDGSRNTQISFMERDGERLSWADAFPRLTPPVTVTVECDCSACSGHHWTQHATQTEANECKHPACTGEQVAA